MREPVPVSQITPDDGVHQLLKFYDRAMLQATSLPLIEWLPCRPSRWRLLRPFSRLPRLTLGTRTLIIWHIDRSLSALGRRYTAREALGTPSAKPTEDRDTCMRYRESLPLGRYKWMMIGFAVPALFLTALLIEEASHWTSDGRKLKELLAMMLVFFATGSRSADMEKVVTKAFELGITGLLTSLAIVLIGGYVLTRPFVPAFRLKRQILNLSDRDDRDVRESASSWHVTKSVGAYQQERKVFADLGYRPPREFPLDLVVLIFPVVCLTVAAVALASSASAPMTIRPWWALWLAGLAVLRTVWLWSVWRGRQDQDRTPPVVGIAKGTGRYVESRPFTEAAALPLLLLATPWLYPLLGAIPFHRFTLTADRLRAAAATHNGRPPRGGRPLLAAAAFTIATLIYIPVRFVWEPPRHLEVAAGALAVAVPIVILVLHLWRLAGLLNVGESARRRYRRCAAVACPLLLVLLVLLVLKKMNIWELAPQKVAPAALASLAAGIVALYVLLIGAIQRCQNRLVAEEGLTVPVSNGICEGSTALDRALTSSYEALARSGPVDHLAPPRHQ